MTHMTCHTLFCNRIEAGLLKVSDDWCTAYDYDYYYDYYDLA